MIGIAVSRFNPDVTSRLLKNCLAALKAGGVKETGLRVLRVPGGYELPWAVNELARIKGCEIVIALGCILKGSTPQNDHIARSTVFTSTISRWRPACPSSSASPRPIPTPRPWPHEGSLTAAKKPRRPLSDAGARRKTDG